MKKAILLLVPFLFATGLNAQNKALIEKIKQLKPVAPSKEYVPKELPTTSASNTNTKSNSGAATVYFGDEIGDTYYDLQTNGPSPTNIVQYDDGSIAVVYIHNDDMSDPLSANRGTGYAYYNATTQAWSKEENPANGIFDTRVGWPTIGNTPNSEFVIAHGSSPTQMVSVNRASKGSGIWSNSTTYFSQEYLWPKMAVVGDTIHLLGSCNGCPNGVINGINNMMWYSRSVDGGATFDIMMQILPGTDSINFPAAPFTNGPNSSLADSYNIDAVGNTVAVVAGGGSYSMNAWKSTDGGSSWTLLPIASRNNQDTSNGQGYVDPNTGNTRIFHPGDDPNIVIDNNDQIHVFAGAIEQSWDSLGTWVGRAPSSGVMYWNEAMIGSRPSSISDMLMDIDCDGTFNYSLANAATGGYGTDNGASRGVTAAVDANNNIFVVTSTIVEGVVDFFRLNDPNLGGDSVWIRDLYLIYSTDDGASWSYPINIASQIDGYTDFFDTLDIFKGTRFGEEVFPSVVKHIGSDNVLHITYQVDEAAGNNSSSAGIQVNATLNKAAYYGADVSTILATSGFNTDSCELNFVTSLANNVESVRRINAYPNPAQESLTITVDLKYDSEFELEITDLMGRRIESISATEARRGINQFDFSLEGLSSGIYVYKVTTGDKIWSEKFIKE